MEEINNRSAIPIEQNAALSGGDAAGQMPSQKMEQTQEQAVSGGKSGLAKKLFLFGFVFVLLLILAGVIVRFVLPRLRGGVLPERQVSLTWWGLMAKESVDPLILEYTKQNPNVTINYVEQSKEDYRERITNALAKKQNVDIFELHNSWVPMFRDELSFLPEEVMSSAEFAETFYPIYSKDLNLGGGVVGIPLVYDGLGLFINEEIFATYGKTVPATWDEFVEVALELTLKDEMGNIRQAGVAMGTTQNVDYWQEILALLMIQNGANLAEPVGELAVGALEFYTSFSTKYGVWDETMPNSTTAFANGQLAMYFGTALRSREISSINPDLRFRVVAVPQLPKEFPNEPDVGYATGFFEAVWSKSGEQKEAWKFLKFISQREILGKMKTGISSRVDMREMQTGSIGTEGIVALAPVATSWYLVSDTGDGETGINSQVSKYFGDAVDAVVGQGVDSSVALEVASQGVNQVLSSYGLAVLKQAAPE